MSFAISMRAVLSLIERAYPQSELGSDLVAQRLRQNFGSVSRTKPSSASRVLCALVPRTTVCPESRLAAMADALIHAERYDEAATWAAMAIREAPDYHNGLSAAAVSYALAGEPELALSVTTRLRQLDPGPRISQLKEIRGPSTTIRVDLFNRMAQQSDGQALDTPKVDV
jgi:hypothetical protein